MQKHWKKIVAAVIVSGAAIYASVSSSPAKLGPTDIYPDSNLTPGVLLSDTADHPQETICNPNWSTKSIRPAASYTTKLKIQQLAQNYNGYTNKSPQAYEEDHLCSLENGGNPTDPKNLWPEPYNPSISDGGARQKDKLENYLHTQICSGVITPQQACSILSKDWYRAYEEMLGKISVPILPSSTDD